MKLKELEQRGIVRELASLFYIQAEAEGLLAKAGIRASVFQPFTAMNIETWWGHVCREIGNGRVTQTLEDLLRAAADSYPGNPLFKDWRSSNSRSDQQENIGKSIEIKTLENTTPTLLVKLFPTAKDNKTPKAPIESAPVKKAEPPKSLRWLHVSDLHFGHGAQARKRIDQKIVCREILTDAAIMTQRLGPPDMVFVSGDVAFSAAEKEYTEASQWLGKLLKCVGVEKERLFMVPGNHDMDRGLAVKSFTSKVVHQELRKDPGTVDDYFEKPEESLPLWPKMDEFFKFSQDYGSKIPPRERPFWTRGIALPMGSVVVAGLNTSLLSFDDGDAPTNLCLGAHQLHEAIQIQPREHLLLVVQHHPPDWLTDGAQLDAFLQDRPHLLFCGHIHRAGGLTTYIIGQQNRGTIRMVAGAGHAEGDNNHEHAYAWGSLSKEGLRYYPRTWVNKFSTFRADRNNFPEMDEKEAIFSPLDILPDPLKKWLQSSS